MEDSGRPPEMSREARDALVVEYLELVGRVVAEVAARYPRHVDRSELWNAGALGLVEASRRFDPAAGIPFRRYAAIRVRGAIIDSTRTRDWASRSVRRRAREVNEARAGLEEQLGRVPTPDEIAEFLGVPVGEVQRRLAGAVRGTLLHLDQPVEGEEDATLADVVSETRPDRSPDESVERQELQGTLVEAIRQLPSIQAEVVRRSFLRNEPLATIAADLGLTEARLSQIRSEALTSLRSFFATQYEGIAGEDPSAPGKRARAEYLARMQELDWRSRYEAGSDLNGPSPLAEADRSG